MTQSKFLLAHPLKHHAFHTVAGIALSGQSLCFSTPYTSHGVGSLLQKFGGQIAQKTRGYQHHGIHKSQISAPYVWQIRKLLSNLGKYPHFLAHYDEYIAGQIEKKQHRAEWFVSLQDYMPLSCSAAVRCGLKVWSDQILDQSSDAMSRLNEHYQSVGSGIVVNHDERSNAEILSRSGIITVPSRMIFDQVRSDYPQIPANRIHIIPYGVDLGLFQPKTKNTSRSKLRIVARPHIRKGAHLVIQAVIAAWADLTAFACGRGIELVFLGAMEPAFKDYLASISIPKSLEISASNYSNEEAAEIISSATVFAQPSIAEGMSLAVLEAMSTGTPIIVSKYCGIEASTCKQAGYLCELNAASVADALVSICTNEEVRFSFSKAGRALAVTYSWAHYETQIGQLARVL